MLSTEFPFPCRAKHQSPHPRRDSSEVELSLGPGSSQEGRSEAAVQSELPEQDTEDRLAQEELRPTSPADGLAQTELRAGPETASMEDCRVHQVQLHRRHTGQSELQHDETLQQVQLHQHGEVPQSVQLLLLLHAGPGQQDGLPDEEHGRLPGE